MDKETLLKILEARFNENPHRHENIEWKTVYNLIKDNNTLLQVIHNMEDTGGQPDVVIFHDKLYYVDLSKETPAGRRSICYDRAALDKRKANKPLNDALTLSKEIGITILSENEYYTLQNLESLDLKTSSWILTSDTFRALGGAMFCENRYNTVFTFHNGADSYYQSRGFRGKIQIDK